MSEHRVLSTKNKYYLPKETFLMVIHYCKQYPTWESELEALNGTNMGIAYDKVRVQTSNSYDSTAEIAVRRAEISRKKEVIDKTAQEVAGDLWHWLILGVCHDHPYYYLQHAGIPCGKDLYYKLRRIFYYEMAKKV